MITAIVSTSTNITTSQVGECLKATHDFWNTTYTNICQGGSYVIANGFWDILGNVALGCIGIALMFAVSMLIKIMFED